MQARKVNVTGENYECARRYMIRLDRCDFEDAEQLGRLASSVGLTPEMFRKRFSPLVEQD